MDVRDIQKALKTKGFDPGPVDGVIGPRTREAIRAFQKSQNLEVDGIVGPKTLAKLLPGSVPVKSDKNIPTSMPWLIEAFRLIDTKEYAGNANNPVIMDWAKQLDVGYSSDEVPWCGLFVGHCVGSQLPDVSLPGNLLGARSWSQFGSSATPQLGAVMVFWRVSPTDGRGHVGFYWAEDDSHYHVLGGNQSNAVNIKRMGKDRFVGARWPKPVPMPGIVRRANPGGVLISTNEQ